MHNPNLPAQERQELGQSTVHLLSFSYQFKLCGRKRGFPLSSCFPPALACPTESLRPTKASRSSRAAFPAGKSQLYTREHRRTSSPGVPWLVIPAERQLQLFEDLRAALRSHESDEENNQESVTGEHFHSCLPGQVSPGECFACSAA